MNVTIHDNVLSGGPSLNIPAHLSLGQHVIDKLRENLESGDELALIKYDTGEKMTYKQLLQEIVDVATGLKEMGVKKGDVIAISSENMNEYITAVIGIVCCGATVTTASSIYTEDEMKHVLNISQPNIILGSEASLKRNLNVFKSMPGIKKIIQLNGALVEADIVSYRDVMVHGNVWEFEPVEVQGWTDTAFILYSSGTTGLPKGVMITHLNLLYGIACLDAGYITEVCKSFLIVIPWYHTYGLNTLIEYLTHKKLIIYMSGFQLDNYLKAIEEHKIQVLMTVPPIFMLLAKSPIVQNYDLSSVRIIFCAAAPLGSEITNEAKKRLSNCKGIRQAYGMTELTLAAIKDYDDLEILQKPGSCGYPLPGIKVKVVDVESREKLGPHKNGEVCIKGPIITKGYVKNESAFLEMIDEEGYLKTGDIGYYDDDGCIYIVDRLKELIKYKGNQVAPAYVEKVVLQHSGVAECGVVGMPDEVAGELPVAFVVLKPGVNLSKADLLQFTDERLSRVSRLRGGIIFVEEIPKSLSGKILRKLLREKLGNLILKS